jgi:hypothetical protein
VTLIKKLRVEVQPVVEALHQVVEEAQTQVATQDVMLIKKLRVEVQHEVEALHQVAEGAQTQAVTELLMVQKVTKATVVGAETLQAMETEATELLMVQKVTKAMPQAKAPHHKSVMQLAELQMQSGRTLVV